MVAGRSSAFGGPRSFLGPSGGDRTPTRGPGANKGLAMPVADLVQEVDLVNGDKECSDLPMNSQSSLVGGVESGTDWESGMENCSLDLINTSTQNQVPASPQIRHGERSPGDMRTRSLSGSLIGASGTPRVTALPLAAREGKERITEVHVPAWCDRRLPATPTQKPPRSPRKAVPSNGMSRRASAPSSPMRGTNSKPFLTEAQKGDISLCVRLRPGHDDENCAYVEKPNAVRLLPQSFGPSMSATRSGGSSPRFEHGEATYSADHVFGPDATQDDVYVEAVSPISEAVINGYNGAVIAYGQTGSGKTYTMFGNAKSRGIAPRVVNGLFEALTRRSCWSVEVSVLEIYNERVRDLLAPGQGVTHVDIHEVSPQEGPTTSFRCPQATSWKATCPDDALAALAEGLRRRETAQTDMNHTSSRSHLVFTLCTSQTDNDIGATLRGRLHLVDLAGSERLKRSLSSERTNGRFLVRHNSRPPGSGHRTPRDQVREAGEINKSLSQLALVIQRLTGPSSAAVQYIPYRDSMLTRLLAESFGGSSKTCLIIACSPSCKDRDETRCSLEFGKRAKLVKNKAEINIEVTHEPSPVMQAMLAKEIEKIRVEREAMLREREALLAERSEMKEKLEVMQTLLRSAIDDAIGQQRMRADEVGQMEADKQNLQARLVEAKTHAMQLQQAACEETQRALEERCSLSRRLHEATAEVAFLEEERQADRQRHEEEVARLQAEVAEWEKLLKERDREMSTLQAEVRQIGRDKAEAVAKLEAENSALRDRWAEDVARLGQEKAEVLARIAEQAAATQRAMQDAMQRRDRMEASRQSCPADAAHDLKQAEEDANLFASYHLAQQGEARRRLEAVTLEAEQAEKERDARLSRMEAEEAQLRKKWHAQLQSYGQLAAVPQVAFANSRWVEIQHSDSTPSVIGADMVSSTADLNSGSAGTADCDPSPEPVADS